MGKYHSRNSLEELNRRQESKRKQPTPPIQHVSYRWAMQNKKNCLLSWEPRGQHIRLAWQSDGSLVVETTYWKFKRRFTAYLKSVPFFGSQLLLNDVFYFPEFDKPAVLMFLATMGAPRKCRIL